ncbi:hypothetical protein [Mesorhizobium sp. M0587]|uniref:hypothetical protein n=1 Tax=Mesorhizobium sp. M0587 TaxID=2956964 RepID=UPI00333AC88E
MEKKLAVFSIHDIVNDRIFLLIGDIAQSALRWLPANRARRKIPRGVAGEGKIFRRQIFPVLPQGQTCTAADRRNT